jgi:hypothetical protein
VSGTNLYFKGNNVLGSSPAGSINTSQGTYIQIDGRDATALATVFARVGYNPHTGVLSGVLADNGGPVRTVAINPAGIAHDTGVNGALPPDTFDLNNNLNTAEPLPVDARGFARVVGGTVDIGAFEQQQGATFIVTTLADETYDGGTLAQETADGSGLSLREAIGLANKDPTSADTITFAPGLIGGGTHGVNDGVLLLTNGQLKINGNVTIEGDVNGDQTPDITIDGQGASRDLSIVGGNVSIDGLTITNGYALVHGGGVSLGYGGAAPANVAISHSIISNNNAAYGGGISVDFGDSLQLTNSVVSGNSAYYVGGGIANVGTLALRDTTVSGNRSGYTGGGIANHYVGTLTVVNSTISNNTITNGSPGIYDSAGAGLYNAGSATLANTTIAGNKGAYAGGGIYNSGDLTLTNATIANNSAYNGGGLYNAACGCGNATLNDSTLTGNNADQFGGGIYNANGTVTLTNTIVAGNRRYQGSDIATGYGTTNYTGVNLFSQTGAGRPGTDIVQADLTQVFADLTTVDPDGMPSSGDEFQAGTLANNGGPIETVAIKVGGSAQNTGSTADLPSDTFDLNNNADTGEPLPVDARGAPRVSGAAVDVGAYEAQPPVLNNVPASASYTEQAAPVELSPAFGNPAALTVTDIGVPPTQSVIAAAVVTVATGAVAGDVLAATTAGTNIAASYDSTTETLTLTGNDTLTDYSQVLDSVTFNSTSDNPTNLGSSATRVDLVRHRGQRRHQRAQHDHGERHGGQRRANALEYPRHRHRHRAWRSRDAGRQCLGQRPGQPRLRGRHCEGCCGRVRGRWRSNGRQRRGHQHHVELQPDDGDAHAHRLGHAGELPERAQFGPLRLIADLQPDELRLESDPHAHLGAQRRVRFVQPERRPDRDGEHHGDQQRADPRLGRGRDQLHRERRAHHGVAEHHGQRRGQPQPRQRNRINRQRLRG